MTDLIDRGMAQDKITVFPIYTNWKKMAFQDPAFDLRKKYSQFDFVVIMMGRLERVKRVDVAIKVFAQFLKRYPKSGFFIVGDGNQERELKKMVNGMRLSDSVIFVPWAEDIVSYYKGADCVLLTSEYEGWSRVAIESLACGCPIIMTDVGCAGEVVKNNENGLIVPVNEQAAIVEALETLKLSPDLRVGFAQNAKNALEQLPDKEATLQLYKKTWEKAIEK